MSAVDSRPTPSLAARLDLAGQQICLAAKALAHLAAISEDEDIALSPHAARLESRAAELMRTVARLADDLGVSEAWGLEVLFGPGAEATPADHTTPVDPVLPVDGDAMDDPEGSVELEPLELLQPLMPARTRGAAASTPPWATRALPPPPLACCRWPAAAEGDQARPK